MKGAFSGFTKAANNKHNGSGALWAKRRRGRLHHSIRNFTDTDLFRNRKQAWQTVSHLCSNTRARFDTTRQLLRSETPTSTVVALYKLSSNLPRRPQTSPQGITNSFAKTASQHTASNQTHLCTTPYVPYFSRGSSPIPPNQHTGCKTQSFAIPRSQHKGSVQKASPHTTNLTQLATSPQHLATSARDRVHLCISAIHSGLATLTQQPHCHSTCRAATTAQVPCLFRQEQCTAEEFSIGGTAHQVHQGLAQTLPYTL